MVTILTAFAVQAFGGQFAHTYLAEQPLTPTYDGLYDSTGTLVSADSYVQKMSYTLSYDTFENSPIREYDAPSQDFDGGGPEGSQRIWKTELKVIFNNNLWQNHKYSAGLGFQVLNHIMTHDTINQTYGFSYEIDYFANPRPNHELTQLVGYNPTTDKFWADLDYADIKPRWMRFSEFTTISADGLTASRVWYSRATGRFPWASSRTFDSANGLPHETFVTDQLPSPTKFIGTLWMFPRASHAGFSSFDKGNSTDYAFGGS